MRVAVCWCEEGLCQCGTREISSAAMGIEMKEGNEGLKEEGLGVPRLRSP